MAKSRSLITVSLTFILLLVIAAAATVAGLKFEFFKPELAISPGFTLLGKQKAISITARDSLSGLKEIEVSILQAGKEVRVAKYLFLRDRFLLRGQVKEHTAPLILRALDAGLTDGQATLRVSASDHSWWGWFSGNKRVIEKKICIDTQPPAVSVLSPAHNLNLGGSGLIVYRTDSDVTVSGVRVGEKLYHGYPKKGGGKGVYVAYFALPWNAAKDISLAVVASDEAGNTSRIPFLYHIRHRKFRTDRITLSSAFLEGKMPEFMGQSRDLKGSYEEVFLQINDGLRMENDRQVAEICSQSVAQPLWAGAFLRMQGAAPRGLFADQRIYVYRGQKIAHGVHLGVDLASTQHSPVQAANTGVVAYSGYLGIYGNTVLIDHGQGLFSMYAHLSAITVSQGQTVQKGAHLGYSGSTGLAGGDHLHFSIVVGGAYVNPVEWWDSHWIEDNITFNLS